MKRKKSELSGDLGFFCSTKMEGVSVVKVVRWALVVFRFFSLLLFFHLVFLTLLR